MECNDTIRFDLTLPWKVKVTQILSSRRSVCCTYNICAILDINSHVTYKYGSLLASGVFHCPRGLSCYY